VACTLDLMPGWFPFALLIPGAIFVIEAVVSLARGRPVVPGLRGKRPRSTWEFWSQLLFGTVCLLGAASMWPSSPVRTPATIGVVIFTFAALINSTVGLVHDVRSVQTTHSSPG
jgi:hypothetical protein